jgi:hypothetical protein
MEEMEAADTFLALYEELEEYLRHHARKAEGWSRRIDALAAQDPVFRRNKEKLKDYGDLRNVITHQRDRNRGVMAIPTEKTIQEFKRIRDDILSPLKLIPRFQKSDIRVFRPDEPLVAALQHMRDEDFSQEVVQIDGKLSLLTVEGIAGWLEKQAQEDIISVQEAVIADAVRHEPKGSFVIMERNKTVYDAMEVFTHDIGQEKPRVYALLITEHGNATEGVLGLVTPWDRLPS